MLLIPHLDVTEAQVSLKFDRLSLNKLHLHLLLWLKVLIGQQSLNSNHIHLHVHGPSDSALEVPCHLNCHLESNSLYGKTRCCLWLRGKQANGSKDGGDVVGLHVYSEGGVPVYAV